MPSDLVSREAVMAAVKYLADLQREFATHYEGRVKELHLVAAGAHDEGIAAIAALPAAGDKLQQQFNVLVKQCEAWMCDAENTQEEAAAYGDAMYAIGRFAQAVGLKYEGDRLSPPPQETGDVTTPLAALTIEDLREFVKGYASHGHVVHRIDGCLARCGGPSLCQGCKMEQSIIAAMKVYG